MYILHSMRPVTRRQLEQHTIYLSHKIDHINIVHQIFSTMQSLSNESLEEEVDDCEQTNVSQFAREISR